jgi:hypothetical protein
MMNDRATRRIDWEMIVGLAGGASAGLTLHGLLQACGWL